MTIAFAFFSKAQAPQSPYSEIMFLIPGLNRVHFQVLVSCFSANPDIIIYQPFAPFLPCQLGFSLPPSFFCGGDDFVKPHRQGCSPLLHRCCPFGKAVADHHHLKPMGLHVPNGSDVAVRDIIPSPWRCQLNDIMPIYCHFFQGLRLASFGSWCAAAAAV